MKRLALFAALLASCGPLSAQEKENPKAEARRLVDDAKTKSGQEAIDLCDQALKKDPLLAEAWITRGANKRIDDPAGALSDFAAAEACVSGEFASAAYFWRAVTLLDAYLDRTAAWDELDRLRKRGVGAWAWMGSGLQKLLMGRFEDADLDFEKAEKQDPNTPLVNRFRAHAAWDLGIIFAPDFAAKALKAAPNDPSVAATKSMLDGDGDWDAAGRALDKIASEHPKLAWAHAAKAKMFLKAKRWDDALAALDAADKAAPASSMVAFYRGRALSELGKNDEALVALTNAWTWDSQMGEAIAARAELRMKMRDWSGAIRDYEAARRFALTEADEGRLKNQIDAANERLKRDRQLIGSVTGYCGRAEKYMEEGDFERAGKDLEEATKLDPKATRPVALWAKYWALQKNIEKTFEAAQKAIDAGTDQLYRWMMNDKAFETLRQDPKWRELRRTLKLKTQQDWDARAQDAYNNAVAVKGDLARCKPLFLESIADYDEILKQWPDQTIAVFAAYNASCCFSLMGDVDKAFSYMYLALEKGYGNDAQEQEHMEKNDSDLENMRKDPRWAELVKKLKEKAPK